MAILKHIAVKNADYGEALRYLIYQHDELTGKPILDENGEMQLRDEYYIDGINCSPLSFGNECQELNTRYNKNQDYDEIKAHHYIISFDPKDKEECGLTGERAQQLGMEYAAKNFPGHQALVCTHMDGQNGSGNIHVHIVINSLRKYDVERQSFMERPCDSRAGYKHHVTKKYLAYLKQSLMDMCRRENLHQIDLLSPARQHITEKEYWAKRQGQIKMDKLNQQMAADGVTPRKTKFQTEKDYLRHSIDEASATACSVEEFQKSLSERFNVLLKISRGRFSYLHPDRTKPVTGRKLGADYTEDFLLNLFQENAKEKKAAQYKTGQEEKMKKEKISNPHTFKGQQNASRQKPDGHADPQNTKKQNSYTDQDHTAQDSYPISVLSIKSSLRLVVDLQDCVKAHQSTAYAQKVKLSNLKQMALTVAYVQEHGYDTRENLEDALTEAKTQADTFRKSLKATEDRLRDINEQIHYTGQYLANKPVYAQFSKSKDKGRFRQEHSSEIALYEAALKFLKGRSSHDTASGNTTYKLPSLKVLKAEKEKLMEEKNAKKETYRHCRDYQKELDTVCSNVDAILGRTRIRQRKKEIDIS